MKLPSYPQKGKPVEDTVRGMIDYLRSITVRGIAGGRVVTTANGTTLIPPKRKAGMVTRYVTHPFRLFGQTVSGVCRLHTWEGACSVNSWAWNSTNVYGVTREIVPSIGSGVMIGPAMPIGNAGAGYITLMASTTYGIWLKVGALDNFPAVSTANAIAGLFPNSSNVHFQTFDFDVATIVEDSTNTEASNAFNVGDAEHLAMYLGKVVVDALGVGTITQYRKSDVTLCAPLMTSPIVVSADTNDITTGTDGGALYVTP